MYSTSPFRLSILLFLALPPALSFGHVLAVTARVILEERGYAQTCGYIGGNPNSPVTCAGTSTCSKGAAAFGCCDSTTCWIPEICEGAGTAYCGGVGTENCVYTQIQQCTDNASPACATYYLSSSLQDTIRWPSFACAAVPTTYHVVKTSTGPATAATTPSGGQTSADGSTSPTTNNEGQGSAPAPTPTTTSSADSGGAGGGAGSDPLSKPAEIATIVGTIVAFFALIAAVYFGVKEMQKRHNKGQTGSREESTYEMK